MLSVSALAMEALRGPHQVYTRVEVWLDGVRQLEGLPINGGSVRASLQSRVTRTLNLDVPPEWFPESPADLLAPFGTELRAYRGVSIGGNTTHPSYVWPVFRGPIGSIRWTTAGTCAIQAVDRAGDVAGAQFLAPISVTAGDRLHSRVQSFISEAVDDAEFAPFTLVDRILPTLAWDEDRGKALDDLAATAGGFWYALADGRFILTPVPWVYSDGVVDLTLDDTDPILRGASIEYSRDGVYNMFVARSERTDGSAPDRYVTQVTDAASPIRFDGPYGRRVLHHSVQGANNGAALQLIGETLKQRSQALAETWSAAIVPFPALELGDLLYLDVVGPTGKRRRSRQVVAGFTMPLTSSQDMSLDLRALVPPGEAIV